MFVGDDGDYQAIQRLKRDGTYAFATCYDIDWGFILPCESGVVFKQQTDGCCCHHVFLEGILIPLHPPTEFRDDRRINILADLQDANYRGKPTRDIWARIKKQSHIRFDCIESPAEMPPNQEGFQWIRYHGHDDGYGQMFALEGWKNKPIVLIYPNSD